MKFVLIFFLLSLLFYGHKDSSHKEICYDDTLEFIGLISHHYELIVFHFDKINSCFIKNNPDVLIESEVFLKDNLKTEMRKFMESISLINCDGSVKERESKIWWGYGGNNKANRMKWEYEYENNALIKETWYVEESDSLSNNKNLSSYQSSLFNEQIFWKQNSEIVIERDSLSRLKSKIKNDSYSDEEYESKFIYEGNKEIEEYFDKNLDENGKHILERDGEGNIIKNTTYILKKDKWIPLYQREYFYGIENKKEKESLNRWSWGNETIKEKELYIYTYNQNDRLSEIEKITEYLGSVEQEEIRDTIKIEYDSNGYLSKINQGIDIFLFNYGIEGFLKNFLWQGIIGNDTTNILKIDQSFKNNEP